MKPRIKRNLPLICGTAIGCAAVLWFAYDQFWPGPLNRHALRSYAQLAPFPASAGQFQTSKEGYIFKRRDQLSFVAPVADIEKWLDQSPGLQGVVPTTPSPGVRDFWYYVGDSDEGVEVKVDDTSHRVSIEVISGGR